MTDPSLTLMREADILTGVRPQMAPEEIRARQVSSTPEIQMVRYLCDELAKTRDSGARAEIRKRLDIQVAHFPHLRSLAKQRLAERGFVYSPVDVGGRPKQWADEQARQRAWRRKFRAKPIVDKGRGA